MLSAADNEMLCRVEAGTPMGTVLRNFWIPACLLEEIPPAGDGPVRVSLLGEKLIAWRAGDGKVALLAENCPHRGASLILGRDEGDGLRCIYHGWKMAASGQVVEMPGEPANSKMCGRVRTPSYPTHEAGGLLWAWMGKGEPPAPPHFAWMDLPDGHFVARKTIYNVNFVQSLEGSIDSAHSDFLHSDATTASGNYRQDEVHEDGKRSRPSVDTAPTIEVHDTEFGFVYGATRKAVADPERLKYVRATAYVMPFYSLIPPVYMQASVPLDSFNTAMYLIWFNTEEPLDATEVLAHETFLGLRRDIDLLPDFRRPGNVSNRWLQDRHAMKTGASYTGIEGTTMQDICVQESMGPIQDRTVEHLGMSDKAIVAMRRKLLALARAIRDGKPVDPSAYPYDVRSAYGAAATMEHGKDWWATMYGDAGQEAPEPVA